jgi:5-oxoprolinase (ATP-hydrolysing) subunit A
MVRIDVNCDMGESFGVYRIGAEEDALFELVSSANVACGFHAGDPRIIDHTVGLAVRHGVAVGAHPSHHDLRGFGRREVKASPDEVEADVVYQVGAVLAFARAHGAPLVHVKPHGALYNQAVSDEALSGAIARGIARVGRELIFVGLATSDVMRSAAEKAGLRYAGEAFADRVYNPDGTLQSRRIEGSVITDSRRAAEQALRIATEKSVIAHDGTRVPLEAETLCLHGDNVAALENARAVRRALEEKGVVIQGLAS